MGRTHPSRRRPLFTLSLGLLYLTLIVLIPVCALVLRGASLSLAEVAALFRDRNVLSACRLTFGISLLAALFNMVTGFMTAWVLVRYRFPGRRLLDALVDLPFTLPTAVAGIALAGLYAPDGWIGRLFDAAGIQIAYTPKGIFVALVFVGLPFVIRTVAPALENLDRTLEEAAHCLGASPFYIFRRIQLPALLPALLTGFTMAFARGLGEYGSVIFIAGNQPGESEILPLLIVSRLETYDFKGATALALGMLVISFVFLLAINLLQRWQTKTHA